MTTQNYISSVDLGHRYKDPASYQFVYASQLYGTLFGIFAQFNGQKTDTEFQVQHIKLVILNYHGLLNIRFKNPILVKHEKEDIIYFELQGGGSDDDASLDLRTEPIVVKKEQRRILNFQRILFPLKNSTPVGPSPDPTKPIIGNPDTDTLFDEEFYYRNGVECYYNNLRRPGMVGCAEKNADFVMPSGRCHESFVSLIYH